MATATGVYHTSYRKDFALRHTRAEYIRLGLLAAVAVWLPYNLDQYWLGYANLILLAAIAAVGLNILTGYTWPRPASSAWGPTPPGTCRSTTTGPCCWRCWRPR